MDSLQNEVCRIGDGVEPIGGVGFFKCGLLLDDLHYGRKKKGEKKRKRSSLFVGTMQ